MPYPYGMQNSPVVGNGLGGLPRRTTAVTPTPSIAGVPFQTLGIKWQQGYSKGLSVSFNNVVHAFVGGQQSSTSDRVNVIMKNRPPFTALDAITRISGYWPSANFQQPSNVQPNLVSLTAGGDSASTTNTRFLGFTPDYIYFTRSNVTQGSPFPGFWLEGDNNSIYLFFNNNITKYDKTTLTQTASKAYTGASTVCTMAWISGNSLSFFDQNANTKLITVDKDTLEIQSQFTLGYGIQTVTSVMGFRMTQSSALAAFYTSGQVLIVVDKASQAVKYLTIPYLAANSQEARLFPCGDDIIMMLISYDGAGNYFVQVYKVTFNNITYLYEIISTSTSPDIILYPSNCYLASDVITINGIPPTTQSLIDGGSSFSFKLANAPTTNCYPASGWSVGYQGSVSSYTGNVTKTTITSVTSANGNPAVITPVRYPYQIDL